MVCTIYCWQAFHLFFLILSLKLHSWGPGWDKANNWRKYICPVAVWIKTLVNVTREISISRQTVYDLKYATNALSPFVPKRKKGTNAKRMTCENKVLQQGAVLINPSVTVSELKNKFQDLLKEIAIWIIQHKSHLGQQFSNCGMQPNFGWQDKFWWVAGEKMLPMSIAKLTSWNKEPTVPPSSPQPWLEVTRKIPLTAFHFLFISYLLPSFS